MKFKGTITVIYDVNPENYGDNKTVVEMLAIDKENMEADPHSLIDMYTDGHPLEIELEQLGEG